MISIITFIFFGFGLIIGSFLNVVIYRLNTKRSLGVRSACMSCNTKLLWYELIPVFSFLGLRGRCRTCQTKISMQYPLVELTTGIVFATLFLKFQDILFSSVLEFSIVYAYYAVMFALLVVIATYDIKHKIIPDMLAFVFGLLAFLGLFSIGSPSNLVLAFHIPSILDFLSGVFIALPFFLCWLISRGAWMGLGDAKLALGLGWFLGLSIALSGVVVAFWTGAIIGLGLLFFSKNHNMKSEIPFAPYLVLGAFIAFVFELHLFF